MTRSETFLLNINIKFKGFAKTIVDNISLIVYKNNIQANNSSASVCGLELSIVRALNEVSTAEKRKLASRKRTRAILISVGFDPLTYVLSNETDS